MKNNRPLFFALVVIVALAGWNPARAQDGVEDLGTFKSWQARSYKEGGNPVCTMFSQPTASEGNYDKRGEVFIFVTHRPSANRADEVSVNIGYPFKTGVPVFMVVGGTKYEMFSEGSNAWTRSSRDDATLVRAMRAGSELSVEGVSAKGTKTVDTFSLSGFSAAHNAITVACKVR